MESRRGQAPAEATGPQDQQEGAGAVDDDLFALPAPHEALAGVEVGARSAGASGWEAGWQGRLTFVSMGACAVTARGGRTDGTRRATV